MAGLIMKLRFYLFCQYFVWTYFLLLPLGLFAETIRSFQYNKNSQLIKEIKANGNAIEYDYDAGGRLKKESSSDGSTVIYDYDKNGCGRSLRRRKSTYFLTQSLL